MPFSKVLNQLMTSMERSRQASLKAAIAKDPAKYKLNGMMADGKPASYRYMGATNGRGQAVWFCWSVHRNAAGYFLGWRETYFKRTGKDGTYATRDQWSARKVKKRVIELAERRRDRLIEKYPERNGRKA